MLEQVTRKNCEQQNPRLSYIGAVEAAKAFEPTALGEQLPDHH